MDDIDPAGFVAGAASFALALEPGGSGGWYRAFTRTVFLAGRPGSVAGRHPHRRLAPGGGLAWYGPATRRELSARRGCCVPSRARSRSTCPRGRSPCAFPGGPRDTGWR
ncbi:hypothetical protein STENM327S_06226 [Streptomyces tendae]